MKQKFIFSAAGLGDVVKGKLYRLVPEQQQQQASEQGMGEYKAVPAPLYGTLSGKDASVRLGEMLGKNIICALTLRANGLQMTIPEAIVNIVKRKRIVTTAIVGGSGTVKEFIGDDDMSIDITVGIVATDGTGNIIDEYPENEVYRLIDLLDAKTIDIYSPFLDLFDLDGGMFKIVVTDYSVTQSTHTNRQVVTVNALSDYDYTIYYEEN
jgi:hypothetical protein